MGAATMRRFKLERGVGEWKEKADIYRYEKGGRAARAGAGAVNGRGGGREDGGRAASLNEERVEGEAGAVGRNGERNRGLSQTADRRRRRALGADRGRSRGRQRGTD